MVDIVRVIEERRIKSARASASFTTKRDSVVSAKAAAVKAQLGHLSGETVDYYNETNLAALFYRMVDEYSPGRVRMPATMSARGLALWSRVAASCEESGVDPETYLRAQFAYFHRCFGRTPKLPQLTTKKAQERAIAYKSTKPSAQKVVGSAKLHKADLASVMRAAEEQMRTLCRVHNLTRAEVYRKFVLTELIAFPPQYLAADPVYKQVLDA